MSSAPDIAGEPVDSPRPASPRRTIVAILKWLFFAALIYFVGAALWKQLRLIDFRTVRFAPLPLIGAAVALTVVYAARTITYRILLHGYNVQISWRESAVVAWVPQIAKYVPGYVASFGGAVALLRRFRVGGAVAVSVVLMMDGIAVLAGLIIGSPLLLWAPIKKILPLGWLMCAAIVVVGLVFLHPRVFGALLNFALRKMKRPPLDHLPPLHNYVGPVLLGFVQWILAGVALWLVTRSIVFVDAKHLPLFIAIAGLAYTVSYLTPIAPGGLGVREAIFQATLVVIVGAPAAIAVIVMRIVQTLVEIAMAVAGGIVLRGIR